GVIYRRVMHPDGTISYPYVSPGAAELLGAGHDELFGARPLHELARDRIIAEDREAFADAMRSSAAELTPLDIEVRAARPQGGPAGSAPAGPGGKPGKNYVWIRSTATVRRAPDGSVIWDGVMTDITALKATESALKARTEALRATSRVNTAIASQLDRDTLVQTVLDAGRAMIGAAFGSFFYNVRECSGESLTLYKLSGAP